MAYKFAVTYVSDICNIVAWESHMHVSIYSDCNSNDRDPSNY